MVRAYRDGMPERRQAQNILRIRRSRIYRWNRIGTVPRAHILPDSSSLREKWVNANRMAEGSIWYGR